MTEICSRVAIPHYVICQHFNTGKCAVKKFVFRYTYSFAKQHSCLLFADASTLRMYGYTYLCIKTFAYLTFVVVSVYIMSISGKIWRSAREFFFRTACLFSESVLEQYCCGDLHCKSLSSRRWSQKTTGFENCHLRFTTIRVSVLLDDKKNGCFEWRYSSL